MLTLPHGWALVCLRRNSRTFDNKTEKWNLSKHKFVFGETVELFIIKMKKGWNKVYKNQKIKMYKNIKIIKN